MLKAIILCLALGLSGAALASTDKPPATTEKAPTPGIEDLDDLPQIRALCLATRPPDRVYFAGDAAARGAAREAYKATAATTLDRLYRLRVPAEGFKIGDYSPSDGELTLDLSYSPRLFHGAATLAFPSDAPVAFQVTPQQAKAALAAAKAGTAKLVTYFELNDDQGAVCTGSAAAGIFTIAALPVTFELRDGSGEWLARYDTPRAERFKALILGYHGTPLAQLGSVEGDGFDGAALGKCLNGTIEPLRKCYEGRLKDRPDAGGMSVLGVSVTESGKVDSVTFIADGYGDDALHKCVEDTFKATSFARVGGLPAKFRVPVELRLGSPQK